MSCLVFNINNNYKKFVPKEDCVFFNRASKDTIRVETFKKWSFIRDFEIKEGFVVEALCNYCSAADFDAFEGEVSGRKYVDSVRKSCYTNIVNQFITFTIRY